MSTSAIPELVRLLRPLLLPALMMGAVAVATVSVPLLIAGVSVTVAWWGLSDPENARRRVRALRRAWLGMTPIVLGLVVLVVGLKFDDLYALSSDALAFAAFVAWWGAGLFRLLAFRRTRLRCVYVVLALGVAALEILVLFAPVGLEFGTRDIVLVASLLLALLIVAYDETGWPPLRGRLGGAAPTHFSGRVSDHRAWGLSLAVGSSVLFACASALILPQATGPPPTDDEANLDTRAAATAGLSAPSVRGLSPAELVRRFSPVLQFSDSQRWEPIPVDSYLARAELRWLRSGAAIKTGLRVGDLRRSCAAGGPSPCYALTTHCPIETERREDPACEQGETVDPGIARGGHAYARVLRWSEPRPGGLPPDVLRVHPFDDQIETLVQYWYFYAYDDWHGQSLYGDLRQSHEADWEAVSIGFSADRPLFVAFSAHCGGSWVPWGDARLAVPKGEIRGKLHPVAAVAEGSMAMYPYPDRVAVPDWAGCVGIPSRQASVATLAYNVREQLGRKRALVIAEHELVDETHDVMAFEGVWGLNGAASFETRLGERIRLPASKEGPMTPTHQPLWYDPLKRIFCSAAWREANGEDEEDCDTLRARAKQRAALNADRGGQAAP